jgi:exosortase
VSVTTPELTLEPTWAPPRTRWRLRRRDLGFLLLVTLSIAWTFSPLATVVSRALTSRDEYEHYSHIVLIPLLSAFLVYLRRDAIFGQIRTGVLPGTILGALGAGALWFAGPAGPGLEAELRLSATMLGLVVLWAGAFALCYGGRALGRSAFAFVLLLFVVPLPPPVLSAIIAFLQHASAEAAASLFALIGMPVFRQDLYFQLSTMTIYVAEECSGIRSSLALLMSGLVMVPLFLSSPWTRIALVLAIVPLAIVKNGVRIVFLSWLAVHVDPGFISGGLLHKTAGMPLFAVSLSILAGIAWLLRRCEVQREA